VGHVWSMFGPYLDNVWTMVGPCSGNVWTMFGPCLDHVEPCLGHIWAMFGPCLDRGGGLTYMPCFLLAKDIIGTLLFSEFEF
jgi:hypothetical protein